MAPPYLASQTAARMGAPIEPFDVNLRMLMVIFGALLVVCFVAPWTVSPTSFAWDVLKGAGKAKIPPLLFASTGALALTLAFVPLAAAARGIVAALLGLAPVVLFFTVLASFEWRSFLPLIGIMMLIAGLLLRQEYRGAILGRILVTVGVVAYLLPLLIPAGGGDPKIVAMFQALGQAEGRQMVGLIVQLVPVVLALVSLLVWIPSPSSAGAKVIAWIWIMLLFVTSLVMLALGSDPVEDIKHLLFPAVWLPLGMCAWFSFVGYGVASFLGKSLEHQ